MTHVQAALKLLREGKLVTAQVLRNTSGCLCCPQTMQRVRRALADDELLVCEFETTARADGKTIRYGVYYLRAGLKNEKSL